MGESVGGDSDPKIDRSATSSSQGGNFGVCVDGIFRAASRAGRFVPVSSRCSPGVYVLQHCHNLEHEDAGMMLNIEVS